MLRTVLARDPAELVIFTRGESIGLAYASLAGLASALASVVILFLIARRIWNDGVWEAFDVTVTTLFSAEVIQGISHAMNFKWVVEGKSETGPFCTGQGAIQQLGEVLVALATLTIAAQTFLLIWRDRPLSRKVALRIVAVELISVVLVVGIEFGTHTHPPNEFYATPTPYWCWIGRGFPRERIGLEYLWFWLALFISIILYIPIFLLYLRVFNAGDSWYSPRRNIRPNGNGHQVGIGRGPIFINPGWVPGEGGLLWSTVLYPVLYGILILPLTIVRFLTFHEAAHGKTHNRPAATFVVIIVFVLSGVLNAILYGATRKDIFRVIPPDVPVAPPVPVPVPAVENGEPPPV